MSLEMMKKLTMVFGAGVVGIVLCLGMTIFTSIQEAQQKAAPPTEVVPVPAIGQ